LWRWEGSGSGDEDGGDEGLHVCGWLFGGGGGGGGGGVVK
jgi:hypothetical protein